MRIVLQTSIYRAEIDTLGAELCSLQRRDTGDEYIWQGDPAYWDGHSPTLFPITGKLPNSRFTHDGASYELGPHGFAKQSEFHITTQTERAATLTLSSGEATLACYPFPFVFHCRFALSDEGLSVTREVCNTGKGDMFFSAGEHTGYALAPLGADFDDCELVFAQPEQLRSWRLQQGLLLEAEGFPLSQGNVLPLSRDALRPYGCYVLEGVKSPWLTLRARGAARGVRVSLCGAPCLVLWSPDNGAPLLCIEPWHGFPSRCEGSDALCERPGIVRLAPEGVWSYTLSITPQAD